MSAADQDGAARVPVGSQSTAGTVGTVGATATTGTTGAHRVARVGTAAARRSRAGRTLVAVLGIGSLVLTAAAAHPLDPRDPGDRTPPDAVLALGGGGLGTWDLPALEGAEVDRDGPTTAGSRQARQARPGRDTGAEVTTGADAALEIPFLGGETLASVVPAGLGGGAGIPSPTLRAYRAAAEVMAREAPGCGIDWALLAGIGRVEANHGRFGGASVSEQGVSVPRILGPRLDGSLAGTQVITDTDGGTLDGDAAYDRAVGPMQFLPGTWRRWGSDGDRDGASNPQDIDDAALAAARYLCEGRSGLADPAQAALAVRRYNNSASYVDLVLATAAGYRAGDGMGGSSDPFGGDPFGTGGYDPLDPFGDGGGYGSPYSPVGPLPPGWTPPPGTVVGAGPLLPSPTPTGSPSASPSPSPTQTSSPSAPPSGPTTPPGTPSTTPSQVPSGGPTGLPTEPSGQPTTVSPSPTVPPVEPTPTCEPSPTATGPAPTGAATTGPAPTGPATTSPVSTGPATADPGVAPSTGPVLCPVPCGSSTAPPSTAPTVSPAPTPSPSCLPVPTGSPTP